MNKLRYLTLLIFAGLFLQSCVDQDFDEPEFDDLVPEVTSTISELLSSYPPDQFLEVDEDLVISGVVISDDAAGNFFRELVIQDETGGILIRLDRTNLSSEYPPGRRVYLACQGLAVGTFAGLPQMGVLGEDEDGFPTTDRIPDALVGQYLTKGTQGNNITPREINSTDDIVFSDINTLVQLNNIEFRLNDGITFADPSGGGSRNRLADFCNGDELIVRNSDFASFAGDTMPTGSGSMVGVLGVFNSDFQLKLRDANDAAGMTNPRCGACTGSETLISIQDLRDRYNGSDMIITDAIRIVGTVITDREANNTNTQNLVVQDGSAGIVLRFTSDHNLNLDDEIEICLSGGDLSEFNGLLQVSDLDLAKASVIGTGNITPQTITLSTYNSNPREYESELLLIENAVLSGGATYSSANTISDGTANTAIFTFNSSTFGSEAIPSASGDIVCVGSIFNDPQVFIRNTDDVEQHMGGSGGNPTRISIEDVRAAYTGAAMTYTGNHFVRGIVISDQTNGNTTERNLTLQDGEWGITVRYEAAHNYAPGDEIEVIIQNVELSDFNGLLQVNNVPNENSDRLSTGNTVSPRVTTIANLLTNAEDWESTLVKINDVTITGASTYNGTTTLDDGTETIEMFTRSQASFAGASVPSGMVNVTAVVSQFNDPQVFIRSLADVE